MDLFLPITTIKGIGEKTAAKLNKAGIFTVRDFLYFLPRDYENFQASVKIKDLRPGKAIIRGRISDLKTAQARRRNLTITTGVISDETGAIRVTWFNQPYRAKQFDEREDYYFTGNYDFKNNRYQLTSPSAVLAKDVESVAQSAAPATASTPATSLAQSAAPAPAATFHPIYPAKAGITSVKFCQYFDALRAQFASIPDLIPGIKPGFRADALYKIHFPETETEVEIARKYLAYEELYELILAAHLSKQENRKLKAEPMPFVAENTKNIVKKLPFKLTDAQRLAIWDILQDLGKPTPMNRLLQGDVGSGKTVVAAISALQAIQSGFQVALLAPTAILAEQHASSLDELLRPLGVKTALLTGSTKHKNQLKSQIKQGEVDLVIGTHALITDDTIFHRLGFCIIDEQHRFGVNQRQKLLTKTAHNVIKSPDGSLRAPHLLSMTATPIPRSLQLTVFGDLDISIINQLPKGRQPITTKIIRETDQKEQLYPKIREEIAAGRQVYWICRAIEDGDVEALDVSSKSACDNGSNRRVHPVTNQRSEEIRACSISPSEEDSGPKGQTGVNSPEDEKKTFSASPTISVKRQAKKLQQTFPDLKIAFLHGRMKPAEKDQVMSNFAAGKTDILVSTTVVEVGVNVPNATLMIISDAENYGLAQLHQLRGRVGRGSSKSYCYLISNLDKPSRRLQVMTQSSDGFYLAEMDLKIRGPGEIYGSLQSGALDLRIASLTDTKLISRASRDAKATAKEFSQNSKNMLQYKELLQGIAHYQQLTTLN